MRNPLLLNLIAVCCLIAGCAASSGNAIRTELSQPWGMDRPPADSSVYVEVEGDDASDLHSLLTALLQSDAGVRLADTAREADYVVRVRIVETGLIDSKAVGMTLQQGAGPTLVGALVGVGIGSAVGGRSGAAWGGGAGALLGLSLAAAGSGDNTSQVWSMIADASITRQKTAHSWQTRIAATADGINLNREDALPALQDGMAREIVKAFAGETS